MSEANAANPAPAVDCRRNCLRAIVLKASFSKWTEGFMSFTCDGFIEIEDDAGGDGVSCPIGRIMFRI